MSEPRTAPPDRLPHVVADTLGEALGRQRRADPVRPRTGGPAGNARLTAWTGLVLLALFLAELATLVDVHDLIAWHIAIGTLLVPPALLKTATTGWRIARYYLGDRDYVSAGPPPTLLRLLGPAVVVSTLALLATGVALILLGEQHSRRTMATLVGHRVDLLTLHQASFIVWAVATGLHVLARILLAARSVIRRPANVPGERLRAAALGLIAVVASVLVVWALGVAGDWHDSHVEHRPPPVRRAASTR